MDVGAVPLLVLCVQVYFSFSLIGTKLNVFLKEPEIALKRISASALSEICKHTAELAQVNKINVFKKIKNNFRL